MNDDQTSFQVKTSFASLAGIFCWTVKKIKMLKKITDLVRWMVGSFVQFSLCTCCERLLTHLFTSLTRSFAIFHDSCIKIVHAHQPCSNLYVFNDFNHCIFCILCFWQSGTMTSTFCFMTGTNSLVLVILTGRSQKIISRLVYIKTACPRSRLCDTNFPQWSVYNKYRHNIWSNLHLIVILQSLTHQALQIKMRYY
jgi:hypothetical protein